jgi:hypothetical protein
MPDANGERRRGGARNLRCRGALSLSDYFGERTGLVTTCAGSKYPRQLAHLVNPETAERFIRKAYQSFTGPTPPEGVPTFRDATVSDGGTIRVADNRWLEAVYISMDKSKTPPPTGYPAWHYQREHRSSGDRRMWMNEQRLSLAAAIDDRTVMDDGLLPNDVSEGASAQLRAFEEDRARRGHATELQTEVDQLQDEIKGLQDRVDALEERAAATRDRVVGLLDRADDRMHQLAQSRTCRLASTANSARRRIRRADNEPASDPFKKALSIIDQARRELAEPPSDASADPQGH